MRNIIYIPLLITFLFSGSCKVLKKQKKETEIVTSSEKETVQKYDGLVSIKQSRAINDKYIFKVPKIKSENKQTDSILDLQLTEILDKINFQKSSGSNSYKMSYNSKKREIVTDIEVGATEDKIKSTDKQSAIINKETNSFKSKSKKTGIPILWIIVLIVFLLRTEIFWLLKKLFPVLKTLKLIKFFK